MDRQSSVRRIIRALPLLSAAVLALGLVLGTVSPLVSSAYRIVDGDGPAGLPLDGEISSSPARVIDSGLGETNRPVPSLAAPDFAWTRQFGTSGDDDIYGVAVDGSGNLYAAGYTSGNIGGSVGGYDGLLRKYDASGSVVWTRQFGSTLDDFAVSVALDASGNIYVAGRTYGSYRGLPMRAVPTPLCASIIAAASRYGRASSAQVGMISTTL